MFQVHTPIVRSIRCWVAAYRFLHRVFGWVVRVIKSRIMRWAGHVARMGEERGVYRLLVGKPEGTRPLGRPRRRWVDNIRMDLQEVGYGYMDWIGLAQDRDRWRTLVSAVMNLRVPWNAWFSWLAANQLAYQEGSRLWVFHPVVLK